MHPKTGTLHQLLGVYHVAHTRYDDRGEINLDRGNLRPAASSRQTARNSTHQDRRFARRSHPSRRPIHYCRSGPFANPRPTR